jgi:hypothetical protein
LCSNPKVDDEMIKIMIENGANERLEREFKTPFHKYCKNQQITNVMDKNKFLFFILSFFKL